MRDSPSRTDSSASYCRGSVGVGQASLHAQPPAPAGAAARPARDIGFGRRITPPAPPCPENGELYPPPVAMALGRPVSASATAGSPNSRPPACRSPGTWPTTAARSRSTPRSTSSTGAGASRARSRTRRARRRRSPRARSARRCKCDPDGAGKYMADFVHQMGGSGWAKVSTQFYETISSGKTDYISNDKNVLGGIWVDDTNDISSLAKTNSSEPGGPDQHLLRPGRGGAPRRRPLRGQAARPWRTRTSSSSSPRPTATRTRSTPGTAPSTTSPTPTPPATATTTGLKMPSGSSAPYIQYTNIPYQIAPSLASGCGEKRRGRQARRLLDRPRARDRGDDHRPRRRVPRSRRPDVEYGGWYDTVDADENGDKCAWVGYGLAAIGRRARSCRCPGRSGTMTGNAGTKFPVQSIWSNADDQGTGYCAGAGTDSPAGAVAYGRRRPPTRRPAPGPGDHAAQPIAGQGADRADGLVDAEADRLRLPVAGRARRPAAPTSRARHRPPTSRRQPARPAARGRGLRRQRVRLEPGRGLSPQRADRDGAEAPPPTSPARVARPRGARSARGPRSRSAPRSPDFRNRGGSIPIPTRSASR